MVPPGGQLIGRVRRSWWIGRLLESGTCGSVHKLVLPPTSKSTPHAQAINGAPLSKLETKTVSGKKRKKTTTPT